MNQDTPGCGTTQTMGHGEGATCGQSFYGLPWYCSACRVKAAVDAAVAAERERCAKLCESARESIFEFSDTAVKETGNNVCTNLAAAIRGN